MIRTYSDLIKLPTYEERVRYLKLDNVVGEDTFGYKRYLNQKFYNSKEWQQIKDQIILRDLGHDLGLSDFRYEIVGSIYIHHMNPITVDDIVNYTDYLSDPEYLICTSYKTHNFIHYGSLEELPVNSYKERSMNDTCPWKQKERRQ